jgi:hypothetical protein
MTTLMMLILALGSSVGFDENVLQERLDWFLAGATANDAEVHEAFWADALVYTSSSGTRFGKAELMQGVRQAEAPDGTSYRAENVHFQVLGEAVVVTFRLVAEAPDGERSYYLNTGVLQSGDAGWQAVTWQATREAAASEP